FANFFHLLAAHPWSRPIALVPAARNYRPHRPRDRLPVVSLVEPFVNCARNVTRSTARLLLAEWRRGADLVGRIETGATTWDELFAPADLLEQSPRFLILWTSGAPEERERVIGQVEGRIVGLVVDLERRFRCVVRPWPGAMEHQDTSQVVLGVQLP